MKHLTKTSLVAMSLAAVTVVTGACSSANPRAAAPTSDPHRTIAQGYSLLYAITSQQKDLKKLLLVKIESDATDKVISDIADYTGELSAELEDMAKRYPALTVDTEFLPEVEVKARESITSETTAMLLASKGRVFERRLLLKQASALEVEQHTAKVMVGLETTDERRAFWQRTEKQFGDLRGQVNRLLERRYFTN